jgi:hypothetical protein
MFDETCTKLKLWINYHMLRVKLLCALWYGCWQVHLPFHTECSLAKLYVCVSMSVSVHTHVHVCVCVCVCAHTCACLCLCTCVCVYVCAHTCAWEYGKDPVCLRCHHLKFLILWELYLLHQKGPWGASSYWAGQIFIVLKFKYHAYNRPPLHSVLGQLNLVLLYPISSVFIVISSSLLCAKRFLAIRFVDQNFDCVTYFFHAFQTWLITLMNSLKNIMYMKLTVKLCVNVLCSVDTITVL